MAPPPGHSVWRGLRSHILRVPHVNDASFSSFLGLRSHIHGTLHRYLTRPPVHRKMNGSEESKIIIIVQAAPCGTEAPKTSHRLESGLYPKDISLEVETSLR
jgi:hypothetical protein